jgi:hypothetical protein
MSLLLRLSLAAIALCVTRALLHHHDVRGMTEVDLAFVSPAGGSALPVGQAFQLALQVLQRAAEPFDWNRHLNAPLPPPPPPLPSPPPLLPLPSPPSPQLTAPGPAIAFIWIDSPSSSSRNVLYSALMQPNLTATVRHASTQSAADSARAPPHPCLASGYRDFPSLRYCCPRCRRCAAGRCSSCRRGRGFTGRRCSSGGIRRGEL